MTQTTPARPTWDVARRSPGWWLTALAAAYSFVNVGRAVADPAGFADYFGLPLADPADDQLVLLYASRTLVIALLAVVLLVRRDLTVLTAFAGFATLLPVSDAWVVAAADGGAGTVARHVVVAVVLAITTVLLARSRAAASRRTHPGRAASAG